MVEARAQANDGDLVIPTLRGLGGFGFGYTAIVQLKRGDPLAAASNILCGLAIGHRSLAGLFGMGLGLAVASFQQDIAIAAPRPNLS